MRDLTIPNTEYDPTPCCERWSMDGETYYCPTHMISRAAKVWTWRHAE